MFFYSLQRSRWPSSDESATPAGLQWRRAVLQECLAVGHECTREGDDDRSTPFEAEPKVQPSPAIRRQTCSRCRYIWPLQLNSAEMAQARQRPWWIQGAGRPRNARKRPQPASSPRPLLQPDASDGLLASCWGRRSSSLGRRTLSIQARYRLYVSLPSSLPSETISGNRWWPLYLCMGPVWAAAGPL